MPFKTTERIPTPRVSGAARACILGVLLPALALTASAAPDYVDVTDPAGIDFVGSQGFSFSDFDHLSPLLAGLARLIFPNLGSGAAVADYDGDGDLDIYFLAQLGIPNQLYRNQLTETGTATFVEATPTLLADRGMGRSAQFADLDNDGDLDLLVVNDATGAGLASGDHTSTRIFRNDGGGVFSDASSGSGLEMAGYAFNTAALGDYDGDGLVDIYLTLWAGGGGNGGFGGSAVLYPWTNRLFRNLGGLEFQDVTAAAITSPDIPGLGPFWDTTVAIFVDFDEDHDLDLYLAIDNQMTGDRYFENVDGSFVDRAASVGLSRAAHHMGIALADYDDDGDLDMYVSNIEESAPFCFTPRCGNTFYENRLADSGSLQFSFTNSGANSVAEGLGIEDGYWGWGTVFTDSENDGDLDIVEVNGYNNFVLSQADSSHPFYQAPSILWLHDGGSYTRQLGTALDTAEDSRALIAFDYDRDGDEDLLITNMGQPARLLRNDSAPSGHWLQVALAPDRLAIGASVYVTTGGTTRRREMVPTRSYLSGFPRELHFGLGAATQMDSLRVVWADGSETVLTDFAADQLVRVVAPFFADGFESGNTSAWSAVGN